MKLSKKVLSMVLCGLIVAGGSQATLVNANAQTRTVSVNNNTSGKWRQEIQIGVQVKGYPAIKRYVSLMLKFENGHLKLELPRTVHNRFTFTDTIVMGWQKQGKGVEAPIRFRTCNGASAQATLQNVVRIFNNADLKVGDKFFISGQHWQTSVTFPNEQIVGVTGNDYSQGYQPNRIDRNDAAFYINAYGLSESSVYHGNLY